MTPEPPSKGRSPFQQGPSGTTFEIVKGAVRFRHLQGDSREQWKSFQGNTAPTAKLTSADELLEKLIGILQHIQPPKDAMEALQWLYDWSSIPKRMAGAVSLGELGNESDLVQLKKLLKDDIELVRAAAIQGISRLCERFGSPADGTVLLDAFLDEEYAIREFVYECLLGHGWLENWIQSAQSTPPEQCRLQIASAIQGILQTPQLVHQEKEKLFLRMKEEGPQVQEALDFALQQSLQKVQGQIDTAKEAAQMMSMDPSGSMGARVQFEQVKRHRKFRAFLQKLVAQL